MALGRHQHGGGGMKGNHVIVMIMSMLLSCAADSNQMFTNKHTFKLYSFVVGGLIIYANCTHHFIPILF